MPGCGSAHARAICSLRYITEKCCAQKTHTRVCLGVHTGRENTTNLCVLTSYGLLCTWQTDIATGHKTLLYLAYTRPETPHRDTRTRVTRTHPRRPHLPATPATRAPPAARPGARGPRPPSPTGVRHNSGEGGRRRRGAAWRARRRQAVEWCGLDPRAPSRAAGGARVVLESRTWPAGGGRRYAYATLCTLFSFRLTFECRCGVSGLV